MQPHPPNTGAANKLPTPRTEQQHARKKIAQNKLLSTIREPITFTHLTVLKEMPSKTAWGKTWSRQTLRSKPGKSAENSPDRKPFFKKRGYARKVSRCERPFPPA